MSHRTTLEFFYETPSVAQRVSHAISPEVDDIADERSKTRLSQSGSMLKLTVEAADITALRAGLNTWLSLVRVAEECSGVKRCPMAVS